MELRPVANVRGLRFKAGDRSGVLTVLSVVGTKHFRRGVAVVFECRCDCGRVVRRDRQTLIKSLAQFCGPACMKRIGTSPDGSSKHPLHKRWAGMLERCYSPKSKSHKDYGARGIQVCERWRHGDGLRTGFECFVADMGDARGMTIERVDSKGHYEPGNCTWASKADQSRNRRGVSLIEFDGLRLTRGQWAERTGISYFTLRDRMEAGWSVERMLTEPSKTNA